MLQDQESFAAGSAQLLMALAEQMKVPFLHIARRAELCNLAIDADPEAELQYIERSANAALQLIDGYLLGMRLMKGQLSLELEPVSVSSVLHDAAHTLSSYAKDYEVSLRLDIRGKYGPVMAERSALMTALTSLGQVFIEAQSQRESELLQLTLGAHRTSDGGIAAGVFGDLDGMSADMYRRARQLYGRSRQPMSGVTSSTGAGIFVADTIFNAFSTRLRVARHNNLSGLAATLLPSRQLSLV